MLINSSLPASDAKMNGRHIECKVTDVNNKGPCRSIASVLVPVSKRFASVSPITSGLKIIKLLL